MAIRTVGPIAGEFATIADAMAAPVDPFDVIQLEAGYTGESTTVTVDNLTFTGDATNTGIVLTLFGVFNITLTGTAPISVQGDADQNSIIGNAGDNLLNGGGGTDQITAGGGTDTVDGEAGTDNLIVNYSASTTAVTMNAPTGSFAAGHSGSVTDSNGNTTTFAGVETFFITGGSASDNITTGDGGDTIDPGSGVTDGDFFNRIHAGGGDDYIYSGDTPNGDDAFEGNIFDGGDGFDTVDYTIAPGAVFAFLKLDVVAARQMGLMVMAAPTISRPIHPTRQGRPSKACSAAPTTIGLSAAMWPIF